jgi:hypothetical protein
MAVGPGKTRGGAGNYEVGRAQGKCFVTGREIPPGEKLMAALRETATGLERLDISNEAWGGFEKKDLLGYWQTTMPDAQTKRKVFVDDAVLCELFEKLAETTSPEKLNFRFVLALVLMRKRMLVYESSRVEGDRDIWKVRFRGREEMLDLLNPKLTEQQVTDVSKQLGEILNEEL